MASILGDYIRLSVPAAGVTIPSLTINGWPAGGGYVRSELGFIAAGEQSNNGIRQVEGTASVEKYSWQIAAHVSAAEARILGAMMKWQDRTYKGLNNNGTPKARGDGRLLLRDAVEHVDSELSPHSRSLWDSYSEPWNVNYVYGFADFYVLLQLPPEHRKHIGVDSGTGLDTKLVSFVLEEV